MAHAIFMKVKCTAMRVACRLGVVTMEETFNAAEDKLVRRQMCYC